MSVGTVVFFTVVVPLAVFLAWLMGAKDRRVERELQARPVLDDEALYEAYYKHSDIPAEVPGRVRRFLVQELGSAWRGVRPEDNPLRIYEDVDDEDLLCALRRSFGLTLPEEEVRRWAEAHRADGSFDSLVRLVAAFLEPENARER